MDQRRARRRRYGGGEEGGEAVHVRDLVVPGALPAVGPPRHLALGEPFGAAQVGEPERLVVDAVQGRQRVDEGFGGGALGCVVVGQLRRPCPADHRADAALHHEEGLAHDCCVFAQVVGLRCQRVVGVEHGQHGVLPGHVVAAGRHRTERGAAQHVLPVAGAG